MRSSPRSGFATHDGAEIRTPVRPAAGRIDELVRCRHSPAGVFCGITCTRPRTDRRGQGATIHAIHRVRHSGRRTNVPRPLHSLAAIGRTAQPTRALLEGQCRDRSNAIGEPPIRTASCGACRSATMSYIGAPRRSAEGLVSTHVFAQQPGAIPLRSPAAIMASCPDIPTWHTDLEDRPEFRHQPSLDDQGGVTAREAGPIIRDHSRAASRPRLAARPARIRSRRP